MKTLLISVVLVQILAVQGRSQHQRLTVIIKNLRDDQGYVAAAVYKSREEYMKKAVQKTRATSVAGELKLVFDDIPEGDYAVSVMHDANKNGILDTNAFGIPKEGFGFSNDARGAFGPPDFEKARFSFAGDLEITITLKYY